MSNEGSSICGALIWTLPGVLQCHYQSTQITVINRKSATNCVQSYSLALSGKDTLPDDWPFKPSLKGDHIYHRFLVLSLLKESQRHGSILTVPHDGEQANRFKPAIRQRNACIKLYRQSEILHACKKCVRLYPKQGKCMYNSLSILHSGITNLYACY